MIKLEIVERHYDGDSIVAYTLKDVIGTVRKIDARIVKQKMREGKVELIGYKLTSNNRIIKTKESNESIQYDDYEKYIMKQKALGKFGQDFTISDGVILEYNGKFSTNKVSIITLPPVEAVGENLLIHDNSVNTVIIPASIKTIGKAAFASSAVSNVEFKGNHNIDMGDRVFYGSHIKSLTLPAETKKIPKMLCERCSELQEIDIGDKVSEIEYGAFENSSITYIKLPNTIEKIGDYVFRGAKNLKRIEIPDSVKYIGTGAFDNSGIEQAYIGSSVRNISGITCAPNLIKIEVSPNNNVIVKKNGIVYNKEEASILWVDKDAEYKDITIPSYIKEIGEFALANATFGNVIIPDTVKYIKRGAFFRAKLKNITCKAYKICDMAFCKAEMADVNISNADMITWKAFSEAKMRSLTIADVRVICERAFESIQAEKALISVFYMDYFSFIDTDIDKVYVDTEQISACAFERGTMSQLVLGEKVEVIDDSAFYNNTKLRILSLRCNNIKKVWKYAFARTALTEVKFSNTLENIGDGVFRDCKSLRKVYIGKNTRVNFDALRYSNNAELIRY